MIILSYVACKIIMGTERNNSTEKITLVTLIVLCSRSRNNGAEPRRDASPSTSFQMQRSGLQIAPESSCCGRGIPANLRFLGSYCVSDGTDERMK